MWKRLPALFLFCASLCLLGQRSLIDEMLAKRFNMPESKNGQWWVAATKVKRLDWMSGFMDGLQTQLGQVNSDTDRECEPLWPRNDPKADAMIAEMNTLYSNKENRR